MDGEKETDRLEDIKDKVVIGQATIQVQAEQVESLDKGQKQSDN